MKYREPLTAVHWACQESWALQAEHCRNWWERGIERKGVGAALRGLVESSSVISCEAFARIAFHVWG